MSNLLLLSDPEQVLAKSGERQQSAATHTLEALRWWKAAMHWHEPLMASVTNKLSLDRTELAIRLFLTVAFHDVGKGNMAFQRKIRKEPYREPESHALFGLPIAWSVIGPKPLFEKSGDRFYPEILAIATHHSALTKEVFSRFEDVSPEYVPLFYFEHFFNTINKEGSAVFGSDWETIQFDAECLTAQSPHTLLRKVRHEAVDFIKDPSHNLAKRTAYRELWILFNSVLHTADWLSSSGVEPGKFLYSPGISQEVFTERFSLQADGQFKAWRPFQEVMRNTRKHLIVQIPTGQGKTEGSLLWALGNAEQKILFLLPTQVTVNKVYDRLQHLFDGMAGLAHGNARFILKDESPLETPDSRVKLLYSRSFFMPIIAGTVDQFIYSFFNWGKWTLTGSASLQGNIIIDEIHLYDAFTLGLILTAIQHGVNAGARFCVMSATMPVFLEEAMCEILGRNGGFEVIKDPEMQLLQRHIVQTRQQTVETLVPEMLADFRLGKKVLVVVNTKAKAREIFDLLRKEVEMNSIMLYHSQFIIKDRRLKEDALEKIGKTDYALPFIAVCTQVVEVSLDLDFDVLYTENAPIDAIIQRLGRANRKNKKPEKAKVVIAHHSEQSRKYIYKKAEKILDETWRLTNEYVIRLEGQLREKEFVDILQQVYVRENWGNTYEKELEEGRSLYGKVWDESTHYLYTLSSDEKAMQGATSRLMDYAQVDCVLQMHFDQYKLLEAMIGEKKDYDRIREYLVKIPLWLAKKHSIGVTWDIDVLVVDFKYDYETGVTYEADTDAQIG